MMDEGDGWQKEKKNLHAAGASSRISFDALTGSILFRLAALTARTFDIYVRVQDWKGLAPVLPVSCQIALQSRSQKADMSASDSTSNNN